MLNLLIAEAEDLFHQSNSIHAASANGKISGNEFRRQMNEQAEKYEDLTKRIDALIKGKEEG